MCEGPQALKKIKKDKKEKTKKEKTKKIFFKFEIFFVKKSNYKKERVEWISHEHSSSL
tara:strand:+ start:1067 stop:1240 length:174 start_codon:yes stop_codon:yes gene_type:complete